LPPSPPAPQHTLILGLGNPILGDDGVGWWVVEAALELIRSDDFSRENDEASEAATADFEFDCFSLGGLSLMERLIGYDRAVLVDAIQTQGGEPGAIYRLTLDDLPTLHANSAHDASLKAALAMGRQLGARLPEEIVIYAIEATKVLDFSEVLSSPVAASVARAAKMVLAELADSTWQIADGR
jgi:hydrogenase maturation protease